MSNMSHTTTDFFDDPSRMNGHGDPEYRKGVLTGYSQGTHGCSRDTQGHSQGTARGTQGVLAGYRRGTQLRPGALRR